MPLFGIDVGSFQAGIDMGRVKVEGFDFVFAKVGQGAGQGANGTYGRSLNPAWVAQRDGARAAGLLLAGYWYVGNTETPGSQAARCAAALGDPALPLALDWEDASGDWVNFLAVLAAFRAAGLNVKFGYCPAWYGNAHGMPANGLAAAGLALWSSRYPSTNPGPASVLYQAVPASYWAGYAGVPVTVLQFAETAQVAGMTVDADAFLGTREQLAELLGAVPAPPAPAPAPAPAPSGGAGQLPTLTYGMTNNPSVAALQRFLNAYNWSPALPILQATGNYLDGTKKVIAAAQHQMGVGGPDADGSTVGPRTNAALWARGYRG